MHYNLELTSAYKCTPVQTYNTTIYGAYQQGPHSNLKMKSVVYPCFSGVIFAYFL